MKKIKTLTKVLNSGVVAVLRGDSAEEVAEMAERTIEGGIQAVEITMTVPYALRAIEKLAVKYAGSEGVTIGVGTVLDPETARSAILSGAEFVVAPTFYAPTVTLCNRYAVPIMPGAMTIQEMQTALEYGVDVVKLFPGNLFSPDMIKSVHGPLPQVNLMPTGGVDLNNMKQWLEAGAVAVGIGSDLTKEAVKQKDYSLVTQKAKAYMDVYRAYKAEKSS
ncbi:bifunctional 2-keto-4-hydroxyglutarate aldolase/2-keto-3-deoxy-6-phosphogluconate aldolase [Marinicrinis lubricantis]|uniref:Bifunctional 2-keto-4-hydroxyglutarate aldolase/2-keto-3-deoxy-6-phosphogluconate aldolase n=1 Tax=Marinicrinis lubricantis TaxID=2086470 RepID=A0ABW1IL33_9BACL